MGSEGDDEESVDFEEGSGDAMAEDADADADMDADSSAAEEMEDLAGDEDRAGTAAVAAGTAAVAAGVLATAGDQNVQPVVLPPQSGVHEVGQANCGANGNPVVSKQSNASGGTLLF